jgi:hypothetical protein
MRLLLSTTGAALRIGHVQPPLATLAARRMASTNSAKIFGLKDPSLIKFQGLIGGKWVDAKDGSVFSVTSAYNMLCNGRTPPQYKLRPGY